MNRLCVLLMLMLLLGTAACGKKVWPEPDESGEKFEITIAESEMRNGCLDIKARISGNYRNLGRVILELEVSPEPCPTCPFLVTETAVFPPGSPGMTRDRDLLAITHCGLDQDKHYRFRIKASNVYSAIRDVRSRVVTVPR